MQRALSSGWITQGPEVAAFEEEFASYVGARYAVACSNCTSAMHMSLLAVGAGPGDEIVTVSHSFIATANAVRHTGATPVFVDVDPDTGNIDVSLVEAAISQRTRAVLAPHQLGIPCDLSSLAALLEKSGIPLVEDAACAIGSEIDLGDGLQLIGRPNGVVACFSFHPRKLLSCGDGGMITTNDEDIAQKCRLLRQHGMSISDLARNNAKTYVRESYLELGFNYRLTDIQASIARVQLRRMPELVGRRREVATMYFEKLAGVDGVTTPTYPLNTSPNWQSFCVLLDEAIPQERVIALLYENGVSTRPGVMCAHEEPAYADMPVARSLPNSEMRRDRGLILPLFHSITDAEVESVCEQLAHAIEVCKKTPGYSNGEEQ